MGRCISGTLVGLFVTLFMFSLILLISRTVFLKSFVKSGTVVPSNLHKTRCTLLSSHTEICDQSWVTVWATSTHGPAIVSPFIHSSTPDEADNDANKYPVNHTYACMCPVNDNTTHVLCDFKRACMLDVEEVEFLQQEAGRYSYAGRILVAVGVLLLLISLGGGITVLSSIYISVKPPGPGDQYREYVSTDNESKFTIDDGE